MGNAVLNESVKDHLKEARQVFKSKEKQVHGNQSDKVPLAKPKFSCSRSWMMKSKVGVSVSLTRVYFIDEMSLFTSFLKADIDLSQYVIKETNGLN